MSKQAGVKQYSDMPKKQVSLADVLCTCWCQVFLSTMPALQASSKANVQVVSFVWATRFMHVSGSY